jgi:hypothetical protein
MENDTQRRVHCNRCGGETLHRMLNEEAISGWYDRAGQPRPTDPPDSPQEGDWIEVYELLQCCGCEDTCLRHSARDIFAPDEVINFYPPRLFRRRPKWFGDLPADLAALLDEAYAALAADSRRLAVMGVRAAIDMVLSNKVGDRGSFFDKLTELERQGFVSRASREQLAAVLDVGHAAAHRGHTPSVEDLEHVMDIIENLLMGAYQLTDVAAELRRNTPRRYPRGV